MFTGIITATSRVLQTHPTKEWLGLTLERPKAWSDMQIGESIATNGVCLTVAALRASEYDVFLIPETLSKTTFGITVPEWVNLERALSVSDRFGGHFVQGHVDATGVIAAVEKSGDYTIEITYPKKFGPLVIPKGSITVDGVALTVAVSHDHMLKVALIPHTLKYSTLRSLKNGNHVNLEFDMLGKYVVNFMELKVNK